MDKQDKGEKLIHRKSKRDVPKETVPKDPDSIRPCRPQSAFLLWMNSVRPQIKEENPGISPKDLARKAGHMWSKVKDWSVWEAKAAESAKAYEHAMAVYKAALKPNETEELNNKRKRGRSHDVPKRIKKSKNDVQRGTLSGKKLQSNNSNKKKVVKNEAQKGKKARISIQKVPRESSDSDKEQESGIKPDLEKERESYESEEY